MDSAIPTVCDGATRLSPADVPRVVRAEAAPIYRVKADFFRLLGHPARVRIIELLRDGERGVGDLQAALGLDSGGTSQHLTTMRRQGVLESRRAGTSVFYSVKDPRIFQLLEIAKQILTTQLQETSALLDDLSTAGDRPG
jgi:DNA-binding transcriptional ArsR family regulator